MAKKIYVGVNNTARNVKGIYIGVNNVARKVKKVYVGVNNVARLCWQSAVACSIPRMTSNTAPSGTASCSSTYLDKLEYDAWHAFRTSNSEYWEPRTNTGAYPNPWLMYDFGYLVQPTYLSFYIYANKGTFTWYFEGSTNNSSWETLTSFNIAKNNTFVKYEASFSTNHLYRSFQFRVINNGGYTVRFAQVYLNGLRY